MSKTFREKRRARRIASDEAHAWARSLMLGNPYANSVLRAVALYVDGDGCCFTSIEQLADDTNLSIDTVRKRLAWLEKVGAIARFAQFIDHNGKRNGDGRGKLTTDLIKLLTEADCDVIERRAMGEIVDETEANSTPISPSRQQGLNCPQPSVSPRLGLAQPLHCSEGLISEPEPEPESPHSPPMGADEKNQGFEESEPEDFAPAWASYPNREVMRRDLALDEFRELTKEQQRLCRAAIPHYASAIAKLGQKRAMNFNIWIKSKGFEEFPNAKLPEDRPVEQMRLIEGDELAGLILAVRIGEQRELLTDREIKTRKPEVQHDLAALAEWSSTSKFDLPFVAAKGTREFGAWRERLQFWLGGIEPKTERIWLEQYDADVHEPLIGGLVNPYFRARKFVEGFRVPRRWPPRRDGTWSADNSDNGEAA